MERMSFPCNVDQGGCGGTYWADVTDKSPEKWTIDDWGAFQNSQSAHIAAHPGTLKTGMAPDPVRRNRDWAGRAMAARGERVPPHRRRNSR